MIEAYKSGIPGDGKPFPDGAKFAKIHWIAKKDESQPGEPIVPGALHDTDFMVKDSKRFADSGGWGCAQFDYDPATETFRPGDENSTPPQEHDAKCGFACHTVVATRITSSPPIRSAELGSLNINLPSGLACLKSGLQPRGRTAAKR